MKKHLYHIDTILITHKHSDHVNRITIRKIKKEFPRIKILGNDDVHREFGVNHITYDDTPLTVKGIEYLPFYCYHDVKCQGFVWELDGHSIIYATDTAHLDFAPKNRKYDYLFIESNHDEKKLLAAFGTGKGRYDPYISGSRHLSTQKSRLFYFLNRRSESSHWIELHKSGRFY